MKCRIESGRGRLLGRAGWKGTGSHPGVDRERGGDGPPARGQGTRYVLRAVGAPPRSAQRCGLLHLHGRGRGRTVSDPDRTPGDHPRGPWKRATALRWRR